MFLIELSNILQRDYFDWERIVKDILVNPPSNNPEDDDRVKYVLNNEKLIKIIFLPYILYSSLAIKIIIAIKTISLTTLVLLGTQFTSPKSTIPIKTHSKNKAIKI